MRDKEVFYISPNFTKYILLTDKIMLGGKIDRVDLEANKMLHIIDYKTGKEGRDDPHQLPMYDLLVRGWLKKEVSNLSYLHLESGYWSTTPSTYEKRQETKRLIIETVKKIPKDDDKQYFICSLKEKCIHCDYLREIGFEPILN